jgi:hypothetical protein
MLAVQRVLEPGPCLGSLHQPLLDQALESRQHSALRAPSRQARNLASGETTGRPSQHHKDIPLQGEGSMG